MVVLTQVVSSLRTIFSTSETDVFIAEGLKVAWISFLSMEWYSPCWKKTASGPIIFSLLTGYVGLNRCAWVTSTVLIASGLEITTLGHPSILVLNISPYLHTIDNDKTLKNWFTHTHIYYIRYKGKWFVNI